MRFYFYSREHEPIHVHVKNADGRAKFEITDDAVVLVYNKGLKNKDIKAAEMVLEPQIRNPTKVSERCGPNRQECDFSSSD